jgi:hypothetical protein
MGNSNQNTADESPVTRNQKPAASYKFNLDRDG